MSADKTPVTVVGLGNMGTALAQAFLDAGHPTTVWNRSPGRAAPLAEAGAVHIASIAEAVADSPLVVACLTTYEATIEALEPAAAALSGRVLVTLNSGTPKGVNALAAWASAHGIRLLDGAVKNVPDAVGKPETLLYYGGDPELFAEHEATLRVLGGDTVHLGDDVDLAKLYEQAVGGTLLPALLGFFQGAAMVTKRGKSARSLVPYTVKWLEMIGQVLTPMAEEIDKRDYSKPFSSLGLFHEGIPYDAEIGADGDIDVSWHEPMHELLRRGVEAGYRDQSISALYEVITRPRR
ncbi:NAD(P)-dependent oxidoreductase [Stackebrandtia nassauensis]|uniref:6-phosphogluconate dehydrogenase NAD-binding protein n=1 Tax=Stackebrandtia nassauensis (strain DSM 44728 / CIP 108903 / NRRL B-16338 / NBRC 102104 / LLR-40K-21) TaxID=446470 RepID=D3PWB4_STANL|nr:NAD(P)-binding domain-containing protein [Stackebrandtia nassauensis]ADD41271.1 6-phosphogluconate dehydrogenase NAD-binding protein [Stackebrandtia nassauensis DSM 44728]